MIQKVGYFENVAIYESPFFKKGHGLTLPQLGIITYPGAFSNKLAIPLIRHEFGHILQNRKYGALKFYLKVGLPSLYSAMKASWIKSYHHQRHPVELEANFLAFHYFKQPVDWDYKNFPLAKL